MSFRTDTASMMLKNENIWAPQHFIPKVHKEATEWVDGSEFWLYIFHNVWYVASIIQIGHVFPILLWNAVINGGHIV